MWVFAPRCYSIHRNNGVRYFPKLNFPGDNFQWVNFPNLQFCKLHLPKCTLKVRLCLLKHQKLQWEKITVGRMGWGAKGFCQDRIGGQALWLGQTWEVKAQKIAQLTSCHLGKYHCENALWKVHSIKITTLYIVSLDCIASYSGFFTSVDKGSDD